MPFRTYMLLAAAAVSCIPVISGEPSSQSTMSGNLGGSNYKVDTSTSTENGKHIQRVNIDGNGISDHLEFQSPSGTSLSVYNTGCKLVITDPKSTDLLIYSDKPSTLVIMKSGMCTEKSYHGTGSSSRRMSDSECQVVRRKAAEEMEKNKVYWEKWGKDFEKNMHDTFPPGFPFHNQQHNSGPSMFSGNAFQGFADMHKTLFSGFPFKRNK